MRSLIALVSLAIFAVPTFAATLQFDAAELDSNGDPLPNVSVLTIYDNTDSDTDATGVQWSVNITGSIQRAALWIRDGVYNPWDGLVDLPYHPDTASRTSNHIVWESVVSYSGIHDVYSPRFYGEMLPTHPDYQPCPQDWIDLGLEDIWNDSHNAMMLDTGIVPAGQKWVGAWYWEGTDLHLFHSPAEATVTDDQAGTRTLYDVDRTPTIPEPATFALLLGGLLVGCRTRKGRHEPVALQ